jgi:hypothetical protein
MQVPELDPPLFDNPWLQQLPPEAQVIVHGLRVAVHVLRLLNLVFRHRWRCRCQNGKQANGK